MLLFLLSILSNSLAFEYPPYNEDFKWTAPIYLIIWLVLLIISLYIALKNSTFQQYEKKIRYFLCFTFAIAFSLNQLMRWKLANAIEDYRLIRLVLTNGLALLLTLFFTRTIFHKLIFAASNGILLAYLLTAILNTANRVIAYSLLGLLPVLLFFIRDRSLYDYLTYGNIYAYAVLCLSNCILPVSTIHGVHLEGTLGALYVPGRLVVYLWLVLFIVLTLYRKDPDTILKYFRREKHEVVTADQTEKEEIV